VRGWQLSPGHLADTLDELDGTDCVFDPVTLARDNLRVGSPAHRKPIP